VIKAIFKSKCRSKVGLKLRDDGINIKYCLVISYE
jgi:hypothetical protein